MKKTSNETVYEKIADLTQGFQGLEKDGGSVGLVRKAKKAVSV